LGVSRTIGCCRPLHRGQFVATGQNKIIHLEGILEQIMVREGGRVPNGDVLLRLDQTASMANERELELSASGSGNNCAMWRNTPSKTRLAFARQYSKQTR
jgi:multidrug efflux pump subunit AcrA (membrane-fusion protein)